MKIMYVIWKCIYAILHVFEAESAYDLDSQPVWELGNESCVCRVTNERGSFDGTCRQLNRLDVGVKEMFELQSFWIANGEYIF